MGRHRYQHKTINGIKKKMHRHIVEDYIGRLLDTHEHVYHINGDPHDNRIENLIVITKNVTYPKIDI